MQVVNSSSIPQYSHSNHSVSSDFSRYLNNSNLNVSQQINNLTILEIPRTTDVGYSFYITGAFAVFVTFPFIILYFTDKTQLKSKKKSSEDEEEKVPMRSIPKTVHGFMVFLYCFYFLTYCLIEDTMAAFLMTFVVEEFQSVSKSQGLCCRL